MNDLTKKQTQKMDRLIFKLMILFIKCRGDKTLLKVDKSIMVNGKRKIFRVEIMELF